MKIKLLKSFQVFKQREKLVIKNFIAGFSSIKCCNGKIFAKI